MIENKFNNPKIVSIAGKNDTKKITPKVENKTRGTRVIELSNQTIERLRRSRILLDNMSKDLERMRQAKMNGEEIKKAEKRVAALEKYIEGGEYLLTTKDQVVENLTQYLASDFEELIDA
jgi:anti-sigma28 factor (negative regulator of flagellin synthesis)